MPDLSIEIFWQCETAEYFSAEVVGSKGEKHTVTYGITPMGKYQHGFSCTCKGFKFGKGKDCRHIKEIKDSKKYCGWMQFTDGSEPVHKNGKHFCPKCGREAVPRKWGV